MKRIAISGVVVIVGLALVAGILWRDGRLITVAHALGWQMTLPAAQGAAAEQKTTMGMTPLQTTLEAAATPQPAALQQLQQQVAANPRDTKALTALGDYQLQARHYAQAADAYNQGLAIEPDSSRLHEGLGLALFYLGAQGMGQQELKKAVDLDPNSAQAHFNYALAISHGPGADLAAAQENWEAVIKLDGNGDLGKRAQALLGQAAQDAQQGTKQP